MHELLHAIFDNNSIENTKETHKIIELISPALIDLLQSNSKLVTYLTKKNKGSS